MQDHIPMVPQEPQDGEVGLKEKSFYFALEDWKH